MCVSSSGCTFSLDLWSLSFRPVILLGKYDRSSINEHRCLFTGCVEAGRNIIEPHFSSPLIFVVVPFWLHQIQLVSRKHEIVMMATAASEAKIDCILFVSRDFFPLLIYLHTWVHICERFKIRRYRDHSLRIFFALLLSSFFICKWTKAHTHSSSHWFMWISRKFCLTEWRSKLVGIFIATNEKWLAFSALKRQHIIRPGNEMDTQR